MPCEAEPRGVTGKEAVQMILPAQMLLKVPTMKPVVMSCLPKFCAALGLPTWKFAAAHTSDRQLHIGDCLMSQPVTH